MSAPVVPPAVADLACNAPDPRAAWIELCGLFFLLALGTLAPPGTFAMCSGPRCTRPSVRRFCGALVCLACGRFA